MWILLRGGGVKGEKESEKKGGGEINVVSAYKYKKKGELEGGSYEWTGGRREEKEEDKNEIKNVRTEGRKPITMTIKNKM